MWTLTVTQRICKRVNCHVINVSMDAGKPSKGNSKAAAKGKRAASPKKQPTKSVKQTGLSKEVASDLEVSLSDAGDQERQATTSVEDAGEMRA